ncbi:MAG: TonB family protein [Myxococcota bacterium]
MTAAGYGFPAAAALALHVALLVPGAIDGDRVRPEARRGTRLSIALLAPAAIESKAPRTPKSQTRTASRSLAEKASVVVRELPRAIARPRHEIPLDARSTAARTPAVDRAAAPERVVLAGALEEASAPSVSSPGSDAARLRRDWIRPHYPRLSRRRGEEGRVRVRVEVDGRGGVDEVVLARSSGHRRLDQAAVQAVHQAAAAPGFVAGPARDRMPISETIEIEFRLENAHR